MNPRGAYSKKDRNITNVEARHQWCLAALKAPSQVPEDCIRALASQRSFAAMRLLRTNVRPIALNTLKAIADEILAQHATEGKGFLYLDALRVALKQKTAELPKVRGAESRRRHHDQSFNEMRKQLRLTEILNLQCTRAYVDLFSKLVALTKAASVDEVTRLRLHNLLQDHKDLHAPLLSPSLTETSRKPLHVISGGKP